MSTFTIRRSLIAFAASFGLALIPVSALAQHGGGGHGGGGFHGGGGGFGGGGFHGGGASMEVAVPSAEGDTKAVFAAVPVTAGVLMAATARRGAWRGAVKDSQAAVQVLIPLAIRTFVPRSMMAAGIPSATAQAPREALRVSVKDVPQALPVQLNMHVTPELPTAPGIHLAGRDLADRGAQVLEARE